MFKIITLIVILIFSSSTSFAKENFCNNLDGIRKLQGYLTCQGSAQLVACGGLGGAALGYGASKAAKLYSSKGLAKSRLTLEKLSAGAFEAWKKGLKPESQKLITKVKNGLRSVEVEMSKIQSELEWRKMFSKVPSENFIGGTKDNFLEGLSDKDRNTFRKLRGLRNKKKTLESRYGHIVNSIDRFGTQVASVAYDKLSKKGVTLAIRAEAKLTNSYEVSKKRAFTNKTTLGYLSDDPELKKQKVLQLSIKALEDLPDGTVVYGMSGERKIKGIDNLDLDTRGGFTWWGIKDEGPVKPGSIRSSTIYKPRFIKTPTGRVDIANASFDELPEDQKKKFTNQVTKSLKGKISTKNSSLAKFLKGLSGRAGMLAGGALGVGLTLAEEIIGGKQTACAEIGDKFINLNNDCEPEYEFNHNVLNTLEKSDDEIKEALKTEKVCNFFKQLYDKKFRNYEVQSATCEGNKIVAQVKHPDSNIPVKYSFLMSQSGGLNKVEMDGIFNSKKITINLASENELITSYSGKIDGAVFTETVIASDMAKKRFHQLVSGVNKRVKDIKLFYPELKECCGDGFPGCKERFKVVNDSNFKRTNSNQNRRTRGAN